MKLNNDTGSVISNIYIHFTQIFFEGFLLISIFLFYLLLILLIKADKIFLKS